MGLVSGGFVLLRRLLIGLSVSCNGQTEGQEQNTRSEGKCSGNTLHLHYFFHYLDICFVLKGGSFLFVLICFVLRQDLTL